MAFALQVDEVHKALLRRLYSGAEAITVATGIGTIGYHTLGGGRWAWGDCLYMTVITLSTVGFGETLHGLDQVSGARIWTVLLILMGSGSLVYFVSTFTALLVEGDLRGVLRRNAMMHAIEQLKDHVIVCGSGANGRNVVRELIATDTPFVVVEREHHQVKGAETDVSRQILHVIGDATDDDVLRAAGIDRAAGLIATLTDDRDNVMVTITARALNERLRIVAKAVNAETIPKLTRAGADSVVSPSAIGGMRMVGEVLRPQVVRFVDDMLRDTNQRRRIEEVGVPPRSIAVGQTLSALALRDRFEALVVAIRRADGEYEYAPRGTTVVPDGGTLILLARVDQLPELRAYLARTV